VLAEFRTGMYSNAVSATDKTLQRPTKASLVQNYKHPSIDHQKT
jgi:hypothetical protein